MTARSEIISQVLGTVSTATSFTIFAVLPAALRIPAFKGRAGVVITITRIQDFQRFICMSVLGLWLGLRLWFRVLIREIGENVI